MSKESPADPPGPRLTLVTLARDLGVSPATVSNAYNRPDQLSAALRERILGRAEELGFAGPDPVGRGLRRGRVGAVGVLVDEGLSYAFSDPAAVAFLDGLARELESDGMGLLLHAGGGAADVARIRAAAVDAWVVQSLPEGHPALAAVRARRRPIVVLDQPALPGVPVVGIDDRAGGAVAVEHVLRLGHRRLAVLAMPLRPDGRSGPADLERQRGASYQVMRHRLEGAAAAAGAAGLTWSRVPVVECAANRPDVGAAALAPLLEGTEPPTAVVALSDQLALGALRAAARAGLPVPAGLSVVGFDDSPAAASAEPPLTTVAQPLLERGRDAGRLVRALLRAEPVEGPAPRAVRLVVRGSTAPPPAR